MIDAWARAVCAVAIAASGAGTMALASPSEVRLELVPCGGASCVAAVLPDPISASPADREILESTWREILAVRTVASASESPPGPTLFGEYELEGARLLFRPRLPFLPGAEYVATLDRGALAELSGEDLAEPGGGADGTELRIRFPQAPGPSPRVLAIHPDREDVPANLLRAYVYFSAPMRPDVAGKYLRLVDEEGHTVNEAFVEVDGGLWDPERTRLTLLFHPGRLKRGVGPHQTLGPPLEAGRRYRLIVSVGWPSTTGAPLEASFEQTWEAGPANRAVVTPSSWTIFPPAANTRDPLRVAFGEPLDHALALRLISVERHGGPVSGSAEVADGGATWSFLPDSPWIAAKHVLRIETALEDLAGNNLRGLFDRESGQAERYEPASEVPFLPLDPG